MNQFEKLETRALLSGHLPNSQFMPEGFSANTIDESVEIVNAGMGDSEWELWARYESGVRDQLLASGVLPASERHEVNIVHTGSPSIVRENEPYALELLTESSEIHAVLRHDDFGAGTAQHFSGQTGSDFGIPVITKDDSRSRDFVLFYNPGSTPVTIELEIEHEHGQTFTFVKTVEGQRRGGWNISQIASLPTGSYTAKISSSGAIALGGTRYDILNAAATILTSSAAPARSGAILSAEFDGGSSPSDDTILSVYNPGASAANITFFAIGRDNSSPISGPSTFSVTVAAGESQTISLRGQGYSSSDSEFSIIYRSDNAVSVSAVTERQSHLVFSQPETRAATQWVFTQGHVDRLRGSELRSEDVFLFNPTGLSVVVTVTWTFENGQTVVETKSLDPHEIEDPDARLSLTSVPSGGLSYIVNVVATGVVVAMLEHWDPIGSGTPFTSLGVPVAGTASLNTVLTL